MNRLVLSGVGGLVALGVAGVLLYPTPNTQAQQEQPAAVRQEAKPAETKTSTLPLTQAVLYTNGVGYFEREGTIQGDAEVELNCRLGEVNDLLKSLVVQDLDRGRPGAVTLAGPVDQNRSSHTLEDFMEGNPTWQEILLLARGTPVEVTLDTATPLATIPTPITGTLISIETPPAHYSSSFDPNSSPPAGLGRLPQPSSVMPAKYTPVDEAQTVQVKVKSEAKPEPSRLQLLTAQGYVTLRMDQIKRVKLLDPLLEQSIKQALAKLPRPFQALGNQLTTVRLRLEGAGQRRVRVGYLREQPMWKTSYRLLLEEKGTAQLQGWAIVENPSDEDWNRIQLKLVTGQPVSFRMDLHSSLQPRRPVASVPSYRPFLPKGHAALFDRQSGPVATLPNLGTEPGLVNGRDWDITRSATPGGALGGGGLGGAGMGGGGLGSGGLGGGGLGGGGLGGGGLGGGMPANDQPAPGAPVGSYFEYTIAEPVSLAQGKTTMVLMLQTTIPAERLSLYQYEKNESKALLALRLTNNTKLLLGAGPVTVIDRRQLAGEAQLPEVAIGAKTFLTYGVDASLQITEKTTSKNQPLNVELRYATLESFKEKLIEQFTTVYEFTNRDTLPRQVLIEHPRQENSRLIKPAERKESDENTYRFQTEVAAGQRGEFTVVDDINRDWSTNEKPARQVEVRQGTIQKSALIEGVGSVEVVMEDQPERPGVVTSAAGYLYLTNHLERRYRYSLGAVEGREWSGTLRHGIDHSWNVSRPPDGARLDDRELVIPIKAVPDKPTIVDVIQDKAIDKKVLLSQASANDLGAILRDRPVPAELKPVLEQALSLQQNIAKVTSQQSAIKARLQEIDVEQNRLRANMKDLPKDVPLYKRYLEKFDKQEQEIDERREEARKLKDQEADLLKKLKDLELGLK